MCLTEPHAGTRRGRGRRPREKQPDGTLQHQGHQDLHLRRRPRPGGEHHPPRAGARGGRSRRAPRACRCSSSPRSAIRRGRHAWARATTSRWPPSSTRWASTARPPASSTSARTTAAWASSSAAAENVGMAQMFRMMNGARIAVGIQGLAVASQRLPERARLREGAQAGAALSRTGRTPTAPRVRHPRAPGRAPDAARHEGARRGDRARWS